ncbi:GDSL-type esterase/lipase family protein [Actinoplanes sp. NPDC020271]|uniref:SGNH/GDSL hydrolase family protein n=1 Tax=Actinoplanes sp. NPDC020271 TaxID=3363896 RepID=UPI003795A76F
MPSKRGRASALLAAIAVGVPLGLSGPVAAAPSPQPTATPAKPATPVARPAVPEPDKTLRSGWRSSADRAVTVAGDLDGLHVLAATERSGYSWNTVATLSEPGVDTSQWIGQACTTGSGQRAVVVYAPVEASNHPDRMESGGFVATVDLTTGTVHKLGLRASLAYYNPGCGSGETAVITAQQTTDSGIDSTLTVVDAARGKAGRSQKIRKQISSAVPYQDGIAAVDGNQLISLGSTGARRNLTTADGSPLRLHPDLDGGLGYEVVNGSDTQVRRLAGGKSALLGHGAGGDVQLQAAGGRVFVIGQRADQVTLPKAKSWKRVPAAADSDISTTGELAVTSARSTATARPGGGQTLIAADVTATAKPVSFAVNPSSVTDTDGAAPAPGTTGTSSSGPIAPKSSLATVDPATVPWDPDRGCAVARNDPSMMTYQATSQQVEWAADLAVKGQLMVSRPANWEGSGMPSTWQPQALFPLHPLLGGGHVPVQVLLGVLAQESNTMMASPHAVDGERGNFNQGGFYGDTITFSKVDCGYGVGQVTSGMAVADGTRSYTALQQQAIATDYASNIAASLNILIDKWNTLYQMGVKLNGGDPQFIENWWFALWAYNSGIQPATADLGNTTGCSPGPSCTDSAGYWGLGWSNNPANPNYPADRKAFHLSDDDAKVPNHWSYPERVLGWAARPVARYDYINQTWRAAFVPGVWGGSSPWLPSNLNLFCVTTTNHCLPNSVNDNFGHPGAGTCQLANLHCWWHVAQTYGSDTTCATVCGRENATYQAGDAEPQGVRVYPPDCLMDGLHSAAVVDDTTVTSDLCTKAWTDQGSFSFSFNNLKNTTCTTKCVIYQGKIDLHQLGSGFGGHFWFTHTNSFQRVTGTWRPPASRTGWTRIKVHVPEIHGATTREADYIINLGNGETRHRIVNQYWKQNEWIDLGSFNLSAGASVSLSDSTKNVPVSRVDRGDISWDAMAFIPTSSPTANYVALGDSYSSGESVAPYEPDTTLDDDNCHRSDGGAYAYQIRTPGHSSSIALEAAGGTANFHLLACSGAQSVDLTQDSVDTTNTWNTQWGYVQNYHYNEVNQIDDSGWLDRDTTLVTVSIGGNDVGFGDIVKGCLPPVIKNCLASDFKLPRELGDEGKKVTVVDPEPLITYEPKLVVALRSHLVSVYQAIHTHAPNAQVVVVGYPALFDRNDGYCSLYSPDKQKWMNDLAEQVKTTTLNAITDTKAAYPGLDIRFADPDAAFDGHHPCDSDAYLHAIEPLDQASSFHPNDKGHVAYGKVVNDVLN